MKRTFIVFAIIFLLLGTFAICEESVLIDFTLLEQDMLDLVGEDDDQYATVVARDKPQNRRTLMNYSTAAGATFTDKQRELMLTSLALDNWEVELNSSARNVTSLSLSKVVKAPVKENAKETALQNKFVLGVRVVFPTAKVNANAKILPPFEIPAYEKMAYYERVEEDDAISFKPKTDDDGNLIWVKEDENGETVEEKVTSSTPTRFEGGYGVVKNVGTLKAISVATMGMNYPYALYVILKDTDNVERRYYMGTLDFDGWNTMIWENPSYITEVRTREVRIDPIYPRGLPFVKFVGFQVVRDAAQTGGDYIGYFKDVKIIYDKAVLTTERDIADEDLWNIVGDREAAKQKDEMTRFGEKQVNRFLEYSKYAAEEEFSKSFFGEAGETSEQQ